MIYQQTTPQHREQITLGFRAFDLHELLLHFIAVRLGYYHEAGLAVRLRDLTFAPDDASCLSVACGSVLLGGARGIQQKVLFIATDRPMFWLYAGTGVSTLGELRKRRVATFPPASPPWHFMRALLRKHGVDADKDLELLPMRDDMARLGLLRSGDVDAAVLSSAYPPPKVKCTGVSPLVFLGDHLRIPTTGLAASEEMIRTRPDLLKRVIAALRRSQRAVAESPEPVLATIGELLGSSGIVAKQTYELVAPWFAGDGRGTADCLRNAVEFANQELAPPPALQETDIYDFSLLPSSPDELSLTRAPRFS